MKITIKSVILLLAVTLIACKDKKDEFGFGPEWTNYDSTYVIQLVPEPENKMAIIEFVTGVRCPNSPLVYQTAESIANANPNQVNILVYHPLNHFKNLTTPFDTKNGDTKTSKYDFRTAAGDDFYKLVGPGYIPVIPIGNVNRRLFPDEDTRNNYPLKWSDFVKIELATSTPVNIAVSGKNKGEYLEVDLLLTYTHSVVDSHFVTVAILESGMVDGQESFDENHYYLFIENYSHDNVLRGLITSSHGDFLNHSYVPGRVFHKKYRIKRNSQWNPANLKVLAFVHRSAIHMDVIQSKAAAVN